ncbi:endonuclease [Lysobacter daejeonensis GH1-9]|uniref:Endonuclease n=1 Tax=Lysobacter daejeonensis GH1-9 TaxID=1385517 RepID=A0A0A0F223_9GAMM|nr:endonuclease [Lysobacter daejeonensis GH1-9]
MLALAILALAAGCMRVNIQGNPEAWANSMAEQMGAVVPVRVATYNTSLYDNEEGGLIRRLESGDANARNIAAVMQRVRPDIVLLNEFDYDAAHRAADLFQRQYLEVAQAGGEPLRYPYRYLAPVNTGVPSGLDLDNNGTAGGNGRGRGNDAWGYGLHPGQYGMLVLSRYPIESEAIRTFQHLRWSTMPGALQPRDPRTGKAWYAPATWTKLRLSSKSHWDVPIRTPGGTVHLLAAHPTPPVFDGPENRNGARNFDEIRLWKEYVSGDSQPWLCDDAGRCGGLPAQAQFVIVGDYNADPDDGDGMPGAIRQLLDHPRVQGNHIPRSAGAVERAADGGLPRKGDTAAHTGDFGPKAGTLRLDYVLPSRGLRVLADGVFWPASGDPDAALAGASDHHLVWVDFNHALD